MANHKDRLKELLGKIAVTTNTITVEDDINHYTILELVNALRSNVTEINKVLDNIDKEVKEEVQRLIDDGTLGRLINDELLNESLSEIDSRVDEIAEIQTQTNAQMSKDKKELNDRIDSIIALEDGSTTGDAELMDIRVGLDDNVYATAGTSVRSQIKIVNDTINTIAGKEVQYSYKWNDGGYISNENGLMVALSTWKYTDYVEIGDAKEIFPSTTLEGSYSYNAFYDANKNFISNFVVSNNKIFVPSNAYYFRLSATIDSTTRIIKGIESLENKCNDEDVRLISENLDNALIDDYLGIRKHYNYNWTEGGYIDNTNGSVVEYLNWKYTDFIEIDSNVKELGVSTTLAGSYGYNAFYDASKVFISNFRVEGDTISIPSNARYFRLSATSGANTEITNIFDKLVDKCGIDEVKKLIGESELTGIVALNKDVEPFIIQSSSGRIARFNDESVPLVFAHFSDIHTRQDLWNRIIEYVNHYLDYINFAIHTGDYCGADQNAYIDLYANGIPCNKPVFNCVGNHDIYSDRQGTVGLKETAHSLLFNHSEDWNVVFMDIANSMTYYKDYPNSKIRFIVLDYYYDIDAQCTWLLERLNGAKELGYHVVTCMHEMSNVITNKLETTFQTIDNFESLGGNTYSISKFDKVIGDWIKTGGVHVANFSGHEHSDFIGYTDNGVLNICVQSATDDIVWTDGKRIKDTKTYDCFNVVSIEQATGVLKLVRVGNNSDHYLREKKVLCYDYINKNILSK